MPVIVIMILSFSFSLSFNFDLSFDQSPTVRFSFYFSTDTDLIKFQKFKVVFIMSSHGTVLWYNVTQGESFGFGRIKADSGEILFVTKSELDHQLHKLNTNQEVEFDIQEKKGKGEHNTAINVKVVRVCICSRFEFVDSVLYFGCMYHNIRQHKVEI